MKNNQVKNLKKVVAIIGLLSITPVGIAATWGNSNGYIQELTKSISNNFTIAIDVYQTSETDALDKIALEEEKKCAEGEEGTQGAAINEAMKIHIELGSAQPDVEQLFELNSDCFSKLNKLYDLSYSIPSLSTIINSAQEAVLDYSKQKICTAIFESSKIVTQPINKAIDKINSKYSKYLDLNGIVNGAVQNQLSKLDADLGKDYMNGKPNSEYTITPFSKNQTTFETNSNNSSDLIKPSEVPIDNGYNNQFNQLSALNSKLQSEQIKLPAAQSAVSSAQNQFNHCQASPSNNCISLQQKLEQANANLNQIQVNIQSYQNQISSLANKNNQIGSGSITNNINGAASVNSSKPISAQNNQQKDNSSSGYFNSISRIFN
jgi:hypothetical protein